MEAYATVLSYAIPGFVILIIIEYLFSRKMGINVANSMDTIASLSSGMTNTLKDVLGLAVTIVAYSWLVDHIALTHIPSAIGVYIAAFILIDFAAYWSHRWNHEINLFWNRHIVHHSSEEFNLSCALRQSISAIFGIYFFLGIPMALIGIPAEVVAVVSPLHLFAQFWYHTRLIDKMGWMEHILVTPSHHRVHHAINAEYIDKNYAAIFIIWDRLFGTFQEEREDIPAVYGVKKPVRTWNPFIINYQHFWLLLTDAWHTNNLWDKVRIWFMPTGWRPSDVAKKYPIDIVEDVYSMEKYQPLQPPGLVAWSWAQLIITNVLMYYLLTHISDIGASEVLLYAGFLALSVFAYTSLMDGQKLSLFAEFLRLGFLVTIYIQEGGWFGVDEILPGASIIVGLYVVLSVLLTWYFTTMRSDISTTSTYSRA